MESRVWLYGKCSFTAVEAVETVELRADILETRELTASQVAQQLHSSINSSLRIFKTFRHAPQNSWLHFFRSCNFLRALHTAPNFCTSLLHQILMSAYSRVFFPLKNFTILIPPTWPIRTFFSLNAWDSFIPWKSFSIHKREGAVKSFGCYLTSLVKGKVLHSALSHACCQKRVAGE